jgi:hydroxymethylglutaryl-CoA lyase
MKSIQKNMLKNMKNKIKYFDVSLRDGLQSQKRIYSLREKKELLHKIIDIHQPQSIEVGSLVSSKILPQMNQSLDLYQYAESINKDIDFYLLIPNQKKLMYSFQHKVKNISLISSFSNSFQLRNINKSLEDTKKDILNINNMILKQKHIKNVKLYLSCFNDCPIEKKINDYTIYENIGFYEEYTTFNELCLSDTTGNLQFNDFRRLIDNILIMVSKDKLSLHLHSNHENIENTKQILNYAYLKGIKRFDVSCVEEGGCSMTLDNSKLKGNLHYDFLKEI